MPLDTAIKTVLLHDGPFDESDRFLLRAPATDYIENVHFHQDGSLKKRAGNELLGTVPNASGSPVALHAIGDSLHVLTEDGARTWDGSAWSEKDVTGFIGTRSMALETPPVAGMGHIDMFIEYDAGTLVRYVVAYEVREESSSDAPNGVAEKRDKHVIVQTYDPTGEYLTQYRVNNAQSPKLVQSPTGQEPTLWWQRVSSEQLWFGTVQNDGTIAVDVPISIIPSPEFGQESHAKRYADYGPMIFTRLGASSDGIARYHIARDTDNGTFLVLYQRDTGTGFGGSLHLARVTDIGALQANELVYSATANLTLEVFDIVYAGSSKCYIQYGFYTSGPAGSRNSNVVIEKRSSVGTFAIFPGGWVFTPRADTDPNNTDFYGRTYTHGGLALDAGGDVTWFVHDAGEAVFDNFFNVRDQNTGLHYGRVSSIGDKIGTDRFLPHHRLATRPVYFENKLYCAVQQWTDMTPYTEDVATFDAYASVLGAIKPRTTVLVCFDQDSNVARPVAYMDAGKSKTNEYAESEWSVHTPHISIDNGAMVMPNRVSIYTEDLSLNMSDIPGVPFVPGSAARFGAAESPSDAMCRVHRIKKGASANAIASAANFGDGLALSTAVPMWFDGRFFGEFGPLDSPEIINVWDKRMSEENPAYRPRLGFDPSDKKGITPSIWTKLQVVVGYYDSRGNKHRSAPSSIVYVDELAGNDQEEGNASPFPSDGTNVTDWRGKDVKVYFTLPLSVLPTDLEYFAELYGCPGDEDDLKLIDATTIDLSTTPSPEDLVIQCQLVRYRGQAPGVFVRPPRTSRSIYTGGGELAADPWPAFTHSVVTSTRVFALDAINKGKVLVSKLFADFIAPEYNPLLNINLGDERNLLCIAKLDDKTVVFEKDDIHVIYGDGPLNNGRGEDFAVQYISTDVGCEDQGSIVECPAGLVFFRRERGFYLLDRQLNIKFIGDRVYNLSRGINVLSAELVSADGHIRFLCGNTRATDFDLQEPTAGYTRPPRPVYGNSLPPKSACFVWNYEKDQWSVFSNYRGVASAIYDGKYTQLLNDWSIWTEREDYDWQHKDPVGTNRTLTRTPWIPLADNTQGYSRCYRMNVLGRYVSTLTSVPDGPIDACDIQVKIWYDYEEGPGVTPQTKVFSYRDFGFDPFSADRNIRAERLQFTITPEEGRGRCQAVKLEFEEILPTAWNGESYELGQGFEISSIDFEIGVDSRVTRQLPRAVLK